MLVHIECCSINQHCGVTVAGKGLKIVCLILSAEDI